jgi:hypothetical protein
VVPALETAVVTDRPGRARWLPIAGVVLAVLLLIGAGIGLLLANRPGPRHTPGGAPSAAAPTSAAASSSAPGPAPTNSPAAQAPATLPSGWHIYHDSTGFSVPVPDGWPSSWRNGMLYFDDPAGHRTLGIDQTSKPKMDPVADWKGQEAARLKHGDFPQYELIGIRHVDYHVTAADWEFRYTDHGTRWHVINRGAVFNDHQAYGIWWATSDDQWDANLDNFRLITELFQGKP